jgi:thiamine pyrophosphokinase
LNRILHAVLAPAYDGLLVGNGNPPPSALLRELAARAASLIAVDGGANALRRARLVPDFVMGDLDSVSPAALAAARRSGAVIRRLADQNDSDLPKALGECRRLGLKRLVAVGLFSERVDHTYVSLLTLARSPGFEITLLTGETVVLVLRGPRALELALPTGTVLSWLAVDPCRGCTLRGTRWELHERTLTARGLFLSNVVETNPVRVRQRSGTSLLCVNYPEQTTTRP